jgi:hypothetical protein
MSENFTGSDGSTNQGIAFGSFLEDGGVPDNRVGSQSGEVVGTDALTDAFESGFDAGVDSAIDILEQRLVDLDVAGGDMDDLLAEIEELKEVTCE